MANLLTLSLLCILQQVRHQSVFEFLAAFALCAGFTRWNRFQ
jgi:hypothetical protein